MVGKRHFQHQTMSVNTGKNNEKSGFKIIKKGISVIGHLSKKFLNVFFNFFKKVFNIRQVFGTL